jgi:protein TonB
LTAPSDANDGAIADFTMVQGTGDAYAGGTTSSIGTSKRPLEGRASEKPVEVRRPVADLGNAAGPDRSRSATPIAPAWDCSRLYPSDADAGDYATVLIAVSVGTEGMPKRVAMLKDPGHGFGQAAIQCAMSQRYNVALDRTGNPIAATTPPIVVRFSR